MANNTATIDPNTEAEPFNAQAHGISVSFSCLRPNGKSLPNIEPRTVTGTASHTIRHMSGH